MEKQASLQLATDATMKMGEEQLKKLKNDALEEAEKAKQRAAELGLASDTPHYETGMNKVAFDTRLRVVTEQLEALQEERRRIINQLDLLVLDACLTCQSKPVSSRQ